MKGIYLIILMLGMLFFPDGGEKGLTVNEIQRDIPENIRNVYVYNTDMDYMQSIMLDIDDIFINKRQINEKDDTIYCTIEMSNEDYAYTTECALYYNYNDVGGWILDDYFISSQELTIKTGAPAGLAETEIQRFYFDEYELLYRSFDEPYKLLYNSSGEPCSAYLYYVKYNAENCHYDGEVVLEFEPYIDGNSVTWSTEIRYNNTFKWDVEGMWYGNLKIVSGGGFEKGDYSMMFNINSVEYSDIDVIIDIDAEETVTQWSFGESSDTVNGLLNADKIVGFTDYTRDNYYSQAAMRIVKDEEALRLAKYKPPFLTFQMETVNKTYAVLITSDDASINCINCFGDLYHEKEESDEKETPISGKTGRSGQKLEDMILGMWKVEVEEDETVFFCFQEDGHFYFHEKGLFYLYDTYTGEYYIKDNVLQLQRQHYEHGEGWIYAVGPIEMEGVDNGKWQAKLYFESGGESETCMKLSRIK